MVPEVKNSKVDVRMESLKPPNELKLSGNVDDNWRCFKQRIELYMVAIGADDKSDERKLGILLTVAVQRLLTCITKELTTVV